MGHIPKKDWSEERKTNLRNRILISAKREEELQKKRKRQQFYWAAAAIVPLVFAIGFYFVEQKSEPSIDQFVNEMPTTMPQNTDKVTVVLGEGKQIALEEDEGHVEYSATGSSVNMGNGKSVEQMVGAGNKPTFNTIMVPFGKRSYIKLSDGTKVWINSGSKLVYPAVFSSDSREVYLDGEAIFEVAHNKSKPFRVKSSTQSIEVLGTVFNVSHYADDELMQTVLKSGSIKITYKSNGKGFLMQPGTLSSFDKTTRRVNTQTVNANDYFSWRDGFLTLDNSSLGDIASRLSRYYNTPIFFENQKLADETFSGRLDLSEDMASVLNIIKETFDFKIVENKGSILLKQ